MGSRLEKITLTVLAIVCGVTARPTPALADTVSLSPQKDNTLYEDSAGQLSNGQGIYLFAGKTANPLRRGLIAFDLASIPVDATITDATLSMFLSTPHTNAAAVNISLSKALHDWGEGASNAGDPGGMGAPAAVNDATWVHSFYNTSFWTTFGGDFSSTISATRGVTGNGTYTWTGSGLVADVQAWVSNPASNFGWIIRGDENTVGKAQRFNSRESSNPPQLTVTYQVSPATPTPSPTPTPSCTNDTWTATSATNAPTARFDHTAIWTGNEMIVWGGHNFIVGRFNTGGRYNPSTDSWTATSTTNAPSARGYHIAVWTGSEMIVWGGYDGSDSNTGGRYNPGTDSWTAISTTSTPSARHIPTAIWTGSEMIVWGGQDSSNASFDTGGRYNPDMNTWTATNTINPPTGRRSHIAVWTGSEMIVWGGNNGSVHLNTGGRYNPETDTWTTTSTTNAPTMRSAHAAIWTGSEMIVWGGEDNGGPFNSGGRYNPSTDSWTATSTTNAPSERFLATTIWTGSEMIVWGGEDSGGPLKTGGRYCAPTSIPTVNITGNVSYCSNPLPGPVPSVTLTLTGTMSGSTLSDGAGSYTFSSLVAGGSYTVTPSKAARTPGSQGINTVDLIAIQRHFLNIALLSGCRLTAADVTADNVINTVDVIAIQQFFFGHPSANVGKYQFNPASHSYSGIVTDQTGQNYDALIFGDVASPFAE